MLMTTTTAVEGRPVAQYLGVVTGEVIVGANIFKDLFASVRDIVGGKRAMAGHSKFKNIMHRKGAQDKKRSAMFSKLSREITVAAKMGMPDPDMNPRLRALRSMRQGAVDAQGQYPARDRQGLKGEGEDYEEIRYEGYGPGGVAVIVEALTDNRNRTATNVRTAFSQERRQPGRFGRGEPRVRPAGPDRISRQRGRRGQGV
jgi:hypothetical protein